MTTDRKLSNFVLALNAENRTAPEWIELVPRGPEIVGVDGRRFRNSNPSAILEHFRQGGRDMPIDYEHASEEPSGEPAPAAGWVKELELRGGAVWGRVDWTPRGAELVANREYRFTSPVFWYTRDGGDVVGVNSVALTHYPNLSLTALNRRGSLDPENSNEGPTMDKDKRKALCRSLGLAEEASDEAIIAATAALKDERQKALNSAANPSLEKFVPRGDYDAMKGRAEKAENTLKEGAERARKAKAEALVDQAIADGKVTPASKDYHLAACASDDGLAAFEKFVGVSPKLSPAGESGLDGREPGVAKATLSADEALIARQLGIDAAEFAKDLKETA